MIISHYHYYYYQMKEFLSQLFGPAGASQVTRSTCWQVITTTGRSQFLLIGHHSCRHRSLLLLAQVTTPADRSLALLAGYHS
jgi:hypothetical protein